MAFMAIPGEGGHPVRAKQSDAFGKVIPVCHDHAAFASREILVAEKGKGGNVANTTSHFLVRRPFLWIEISCSNGMASIFN